MEPLSVLPLTGLQLTGLQLTGLQLTGLQLTGLPLAALPLAALPLAGLAVAGVTCLLLAAGLIPNRWANQHPQWMRTAASTATWTALAVAYLAGLWVSLLGPIDVIFWQWNPGQATLNPATLNPATLNPASLNQAPGAGGLTVGVYCDSLAAVMFLLVSLIGAVIVRYSLRYLHGEATQGRFLRWISFTLGAVLLLILSRNLAMLACAWVLTSCGLHQLLVHYPERPAAVLAARKKFLISRLGDAFLVAAIIATYSLFGSLEYTTIFSAAEQLRTAGLASAAGAGSAQPAGWLIAAMGLLFALAALTKSAQFPLHSWLPETMETPTPVSALMHAGIVNAGGFLLIRISPLLVLSPTALELVALVGGVTALLGAVVMLTQTSIKRSLAYSTIAQMGFMMLQCGLGAFSAALLHIIAHSVYKAHAFLSCGSALDAAARVELPIQRVASTTRAAAALPVAAATATAIVIAASWGFGLLEHFQSGAVLLGGTLTLALTQLLWRSFAAGPWRLALRGLGGAMLVCTAYAAAFRVIDGVVAESVAHARLPLTAWDIAIIATVAAGLLSVFALQVAVAANWQARWLQALYVHASNGFYIDIFAHRLAQRWSTRTAPTN
jgi:NAD(P)H-quinone oxidoreductase subunit 5